MNIEDHDKKSRGWLITLYVRVCDVCFTTARYTQTFVRVRRLIGNDNSGSGSGGATVAHVRMTVIDALSSLLSAQLAVASSSSPAEWTLSNENVFFLVANADTDLATAMLDLMVRIV